MALWKVAKVEYRVTPVLNETGWVTTVEETETGKQEVVVHVTGDPDPSDGPSPYLCWLQITKGYTPNDFAQPCA